MQHHSRGDFGARGAPSAHERPGSSGSQAATPRGRPDEAREDGEPATATASEFNKRIAGLYHAVQGHLKEKDAEIKRLKEELEAAHKAAAVQQQAVRVLVAGLSRQAGAIRTAAEALESTAVGGAHSGSAATEELAASARQVVSLISTTFKELHDAVDALPVAVASVSPSSSTPSAASVTSPVHAGSQQQGAVSHSPAASALRPASAGVASVPMAQRPVSPQVTGGGGGAGYYGPSAAAAASSAPPSAQSTGGGGGGGSYYGSMAAGAGGWGAYGGGGYGGGAGGASYVAGAGTLAAGGGQYPQPHQQQQQYAYSGYGSGYGSGGGYAGAPSGSNNHGGGWGLAPPRS